MKVALVHDYLSEFGGAERVLKALTEIYPQAPIYTAFKSKNSTAAKEFCSSQIIESKYAPIIKRFKLYSPLRFLAPKIWNSFNFSSYDIIISSASWYITRGTKWKKANSKKPVFFCYCHTPPRYLYGYKTAIEWQKYWPIKIYAALINNFLRQYDFQSAQKVDYFMANSFNVKKRIKKFYRRQAAVIYPPVKVAEIKKASQGIKPKNYYLLVSRVVGAKGISLAMKAANKLNLNLKIVGEKAGLKWQEKEWQKLKTSRIEFLGRVPDKKLWRLYAGCRAFLALAQDEDFGITVVEAMAAGRPVIAFKGGGYQETVIENKTGVFFTQPTTASLNKAIKKLNQQINSAQPAINPKNCFKQAEKFSWEKFKAKIKSFVAEKQQKYYYNNNE